MRRFHIGSPEWAPPRVPIQLPLGYGSLGWLVHLLRKHKVDLLEVDLAPIAHACYDYWRSVGDLDEASDSLAILAHLTERKAERLLMPEPEPEAEPEAGWLEPTRLPDKYLPRVEFLRACEEKRLQIFFRGYPVDPDSVEAPLPANAELPDALWLALRRVLQRVSPAPTAIPERRYFSIHARMVALREQLKQSARPVRLETLLEQGATDIYEVLVSFLAVLELWRLGQIAVSVDEQQRLWVEAAQEK